MLTLFTLDTLKHAGTLANSGDPDEMVHKAAFHQGLHYHSLFAKIESIIRDRNISSFRNFDKWPFKYKMDKSMLIESIYILLNKSLARINKN